MVYNYNGAKVAVSVEAKAPSNLALVKYWGKKGVQQPINPSISITLDKSYTKTVISVSPYNNPAKTPAVEFLYDGQKRKAFETKVDTFFNRIVPYSPWVLHHNIVINSVNTFPHSSGIASSASSMASIAMGLMLIESELLGGNKDYEYRIRKASFLARLGSGSAARSVQGPIVIWGKSKLFPSSNDLWGIPFESDFDLHPVFKSFCDTILIVDSKSKKKSSSKGHSQMENHPFKKARISQANIHLEALKESLVSGDLDGFIPVVERDALTLHALMMSSDDYYLLLKPNTLEIIHQVWEYREQTKIPLMFSLDAGANIHLLYPHDHKAKIYEFIDNELKRFCERGKVIHDSVGMGAEAKIIPN